MGWSQICRPGIAHRPGKGRKPHAQKAAAAIERKEQAVQARLARDIFGNPFRLVTLDRAWLTSSTTALAKAIYEERAFDRLPVLADALEDAGCTNADMLAHCRGGGHHVRGCWVVDMILEKE